jgi:hypothetical protein
MTTKCMGHIGLSIAAVFTFTLLTGCETQRNTRQSSQPQPPPSQAGSPGQQGTMSGQSPMEHDKSGERMIK